MTSTDETETSWATSGGLLYSLNVPSQRGDYFPEAHPLVHVRVPASLEELNKRSWPFLAHRWPNTLLNLPRKSIRRKNAWNIRCYDSIGVGSHVFARMPQVAD